jgi:hypothetical protein
MRKRTQGFGGSAEQSELEAVHHRLSVPCCGRDVQLSRHWIRVADASLRLYLGGGRVRSRRACTRSVAFLRAAARHPGTLLAWTRRETAGPPGARRRQASRRDQATAMESRRRRPLAHMGRSRQLRGAPAERAVLLRAGGSRECRGDAEGGDSEVSWRCPGGRSVCLVKPHLLSPHLLQLC